MHSRVHFIQIHSKMKKKHAPQLYTWTGWCFWMQDIENNSRQVSILYVHSTLYITNRFWNKSWIASSVYTNTIKRLEENNDRMGCRRGILHKIDLYSHTHIFISFDKSLLQWYNLRQKQNSNLHLNFVPNMCVFIWYICATNSFQIRKTR